ncbi:uncharacterized protein LOC121825151 isoform X2 [Peromyscus maniculatus bairdii]|uniref:uncharacterized protein LOC121825151 isoform X2 n=1 Tax=Peromyscus maniculatus bairdii TaxID=230844 RepID=UPI003FD21EF5
MSKLRHREMNNSRKIVKPGENMFDGRTEVTVSCKSHITFRTQRQGRSMLCDSAQGCLGYNKTDVRIGRMNKATWTERIPGSGDGNTFPAGWSNQRDKPLARRTCTQQMQRHLLLWMALTSKPQRYFKENSLSFMLLFTVQT